MTVETKRFQGARREWNSIASFFPCYSSEQSWEWGDYLKSFGWSVDRVLFISGGCVCGAASVAMRTKYGQFFCYTPRGPLAEYDDFEAVSGILENLKALYPKAVFIKINPDVKYEEKLFELISAAGFSKEESPDLFTETLEIPLELSEIELWNRIRPRVRSYMRKSQEILKIRTCGRDEFIPSFSEIYSGMSRLKKLCRISSDYFEKMSEALEPSGILKMRAAYHGDRMLAGIILLISNKTVLYKWGAASREEPEFRASYLLHWDTILWAKRNGYKYYDLGGVDLKENPGVTQFKKGFGGIEKQLIGEFDFSNRRVIHRIYSRLRDDLYRIRRFIN
ncbi:MAG TPA: hypothetical protein DCZ94_08000 [Lentisphaeria bacterium]|nr:MAG: hypothetical protein A2X48_19475 [Lentisphaerae bacterium GWF2_49_21]HBC86880.1 hypothetical protein [Lentisphaeria bacterium]